MEPGLQTLPLLFALVNSTVIDSEVHVKLQAGNITHDMCNRYAANLII